MGASQRDTGAAAGEEVRPPVESYARAVLVTDAGLELIAGIEMRDPAEFMDLLAQSRAMMREAITSLDGSHTVVSPPVIAWAVRARIEAQWPDRYWFLEVGSLADQGWTQVFSPPSRRWTLIQEA